MKKRQKLMGGLLALSLFGAAGAAQAAVITSSLGNTAPGFNDGDVPPLTGANSVAAAQAGQSAPFDTSYGTDIALFGGSDFSASWSHAYAAIVDPILSATIAFGIVDHDSAASGNQVASFVFEGVDLTGALDTAAEATGEGANGQYDVYSFTLPASAFTALADGAADGTLTLQGPGLVEELVFGPGGVVTGTQIAESANNGANLIFATLTINTQDPMGQVSEPSTLAISLLGLAALGLRWRRRT